MTNVACLIQARVKSTRLPGKTMLILPGGRSVIHEVMKRCGRIKGIDRHAVVIPDTADCLLLHDQIMGAASCCEGEWHVYCGSETDVLSRYYRAAKILGAQHIMRITADCPCIDPEVCSQVLALHLEGGYDYTSNVWPRTHPIGYDCEVFTRELLEWAHATNTGLAREHVTTNMSDASRWRIGNLSQEIDESGARLTLDTIDDFVAIWRYLSYETSERPVPIHYC